MSLHPGLQYLLETAKAPLVSDGCVVAGDALECSARVRLYDNDYSAYRLRLSIAPENGSPSLVVQEQPARRRLPLGCPSRHINKDGAFCLGWGPSRPHVPQTPEEAENVWAIIAGYLNLQDRASASGTWPHRAAWAHGGAAKAQLEIETLCTRLPARFRALELDDLSLLTRRKDCACGSGHRVKDCHETAISRLRQLHQEMARCENAFWREWDDRPCCETMSECRLRRTQEIP
jgi:hypothetical protein